MLLALLVKISVWFTILVHCYGHNTTIPCYDQNGKAQVRPIRLRSLKKISQKPKNAFEYLKTRLKKQNNGWFFFIMLTIGDEKNKSIIKNQFWFVYILSVGVLVARWRLKCYLKEAEFFCVNVKSFL